MFLAVYSHLTDSCSSHSDCQNGGTCEYNYNYNYVDYDDYYYFTCLCAEGYSGDNCETGMTCLFVVSCLKLHYYKLCVLLNISSSISRSSSSRTTTTTTTTTICSSSSSSSSSSSCSSSLPLQILYMSVINLLPFLIWCYLNI